MKAQIDSEWTSKSWPIKKLYLWAKRINENTWYVLERMYANEYEVRQVFGDKVEIKKIENCYIEV